MIRLNKYLSEAGVCSRREADRLLEAGRVEVDNRPATVGMKIDEGQTVTVDGKPVCRENASKMILIAVNKPRGIVCSEVSQGSDVNIIEFLMTNSGDLIDQIMRASHFHEKEYEVVTDKPFTDRFLEEMAEGVYLKELHTTTRPCRTERLGKRKFRIVLTQGLNRQIRRMCRELGFQVQELKRVRIMNIRLNHLQTGAWRYVTKEEQAELLHLLEQSR